MVDKYLEEVCISNKKFVKNLKFFGCDAYVHLTKEKRIKLDNKAKKGIFIVYKYGMKGYKIWNHVTKKTF